MTKREVGSVLIALAVAAGATLIPVRSSAQVDLVKGGKGGGKGGGKAQGKPAPVGPTPKMPDGKPDFQGVWTPVNFATLGQISLQPWAEALYQ
jgi:hypothetical protein